MTRPTDKAIAAAFWEWSDCDLIETPVILDRARELDALPPAVSVEPVAAVTDEMVESALAAVVYKGWNVIEFFDTDLIPGVDYSDAVRTVMRSAITAALSERTQTVSAEPVAWQRRFKNLDGWSKWIDCDQRSYEHSVRTGNAWIVGESIETRALYERAQPMRDDTHAFKNFHQQLCDRFSYSHDPIDWRRDQVSLIEHIAKLLKAKPVSVREVTEADAREIADDLWHDLNTYVMPDELLQILSDYGVMMVITSESATPAP